MEFKEYRAKTVQDAITDALIELETTSDKIEYEVLEEGSAGLLGLFSKDAVVRVRRKEDVKEEDLMDYSSLIKEPDAKTSSSVKESRKVSGKKENRDKETAPAKAPAEEKEPQKSREVKPAVKQAKPQKTKSAAPRQIDEEKIKDLLKAVFEKLDVDAQIQISMNPEEKTVSINVEGENTGELIGKRGQTLDALQYIVSIIVNKKQDEYYRVKLDTNNYRERRQKRMQRRMEEKEEERRREAQERSYEQDRRDEQRRKREEEARYNEYLDHYYDYD